MNGRLKTIRIGLLLWGGLWLAAHGADEAPKGVTATCGGQAFMFRGGPAHTGHYDAAGLRSFVMGLWSVSTGEKVVGSPAIVDGTAYFGSDNGTVYAVDVATGKIRWDHDVGRGIDSSPAVVDGTVYLSSDGGYALALDAQTGRERWCFSPAPGLQHDDGSVSGSVGGPA